LRFERWTATLRFVATGPLGHAKTELVGRAVETAAIERLLSGVGRRGGVLVVRGEAGMGKSAMLAEARDLADLHGLKVLAATGVESEANLPYAGLHQLLRPVLDGVAMLPVQVRDALHAAFGMLDSQVPDRFLTALAALELLADAAHAQPQVVIIDDAQWLDTPTVEALGFIARRIDAEPIIVLIGVRAGHPTALTGGHFPQIDLTPLDPGSCSTLLDRNNPVLSAGARRRILSAAAGNPLALVELPTGLQPGDGSHLAEHLPLTERLQHTFIARFADLPGPTRLVLLVAAAHDNGSLAEVLLAASGLVDAAVSTEILEPAVAAGLIWMNLTHIHFRHPLVRSAVYQTATLTDRRRAHGALAATLAAHPDRRAWQLAASAIAPDQEIADEIARAAQRAETKGGLTAAIDAFARSAELSADPQVRARRLLHAADLALQIGAPSDVTRLLEGVESERLTQPERAQLGLLRTSTEALIPGDPANVLALVAAGERLADEGHLDMALRFLGVAATQANLADPGKPARSAVSAAALRVTVRLDDARLLAILALAEPEEHGPLIVERAVTIATGPPLDPEAAALLGASLNVVGAFDLSASFLAAAVAGLRDQGRLGRLPLVLTHQAWTAINLMDWSVAVSAAEESVRLAEDVSQPLWGVGAQTAVAMLAGLRGDYDKADTESRAAESIALPTRASAMLAGIRLTRGVAALATGRYHIAYEELGRMLDRHDPSYHHFQSLWGVGDYAEAALYSGHLDQGRAVLAELETLALTVRSPWLSVGLRYGRPLLAPEAKAEQLFQEALHADLSRWPVYRARLLLQYGIWLRRQRRVADARPPLRAAIGALEALGVTGWAARAHQELRASGEASVERVPDAWSLLTSQEMQIAKMAAEGMSNREIGQRLFLSHRTVGSHLYRLFPKLGVTSRVQLASVVKEQHTP
jgi:DNA-binding CsgD family transcriptional regulator